MKEHMQDVRKQIIEAFTSAERPSKKDIAPHECEECEELRETFSGLRWDSIPPEVVDSNFGQLPLLSAKAYHYFLPSYILRCLDELDSSSMVCEFTIYSLSPTLNREEDGRWYLERTRQFTATQKGAVASFLKLIKASGSFVDIQEDVEAGLRYWENAQMLNAT
jgi:hypothetical protein